MIVSGADPGFQKGGWMADHTHQTNLVPKVLWVISKMAGRPAILEITHKTLGTRLPSNLSID